MWLYTVRAYISLGLFFYFKKIHIVGLDNVPKEKPILILANHQNALLDALIIATKCKRLSYFLTRASVFNAPAIAKILESLRMFPIYRMRDGIQTITKNNAVFNTCSQLLDKDNSIVIFPEGNHNLKRTVRPLSKGFTRLVFDTLESYPNIDLQLIPMGFNYKKPECFADEVALFVGKPLIANDYILYERNQAVLKLKSDVQSSISKLTTHIPIENYEASLKELEALRVDFLNPEYVNACISSNFKNCKTQSLRKSLFVKQFLKGFLILNLLIPYFIWKKSVLPKIKDIEFVSTFRFAISITLVPFYLLLITIFLTLIFGWFLALTYLITVLLIALVAVKY
jgi:1-acyl-sn-glycerol-3-phosphate acyltransferase